MESISQWWPRTAEEIEASERARAEHEKGRPQREAERKAEREELRRKYGVKFRGDR